MKIMLINNLYEPFAKGGAERIVKMTAEGLMQAGHEVVLVTTKPFSWSQEVKTVISESGSLKMYRFTVLNLFSFTSIDRRPVWLRAIWRLFDMVNVHAYFLIKKVVRVEKPDVVIGHNLTGIGYLTPRAVCSTGTNYTQVLHDVQYAFPSGLLFAGKESAADSWFMKLYQKACIWLFKPVMNVVSPSQWLLDFYRSKGLFVSAHSTVIPNPISLFPVTSYEPALRSTVEGGSRVTNNLLFIGQLEPHKGIELLLQSLPSNENISLTVVGDGSLLYNLKAQYAADTRILFVGRVKPEETGKYYQHATAVVVPSTCYENSPGVIYEAFAYGNPVIASNLGGIPELVIDGRNGWLFESGNGDALRLTIEKALAVTDFEPYAHAARETINSFDVTGYIDKILKI